MSKWFKITIKDNTDYELETEDGKQTFALGEELLTKLVTEMKAHLEGESL